jgi:ribosome modulation factor
MDIKEEIRRATCLAFGEGADARLAGRPRSANPYPSSDRSLYDSWLAGWFEVDSRYGCNVRGRWGVRVLLPVAGGESA